MTTHKIKTLWSNISNWMRSEAFGFVWESDFDHDEDIELSVSNGQLVVALLFTSPILIIVLWGLAKYLLLGLLTIIAAYQIVKYLPHD